VSETSYQAELDTIWRKLRPHLEWAEGFTLAVLFTRHPAPVAELRKQVGDLLLFSAVPLRTFELTDPAQVDDLLTAILSSRPLGGSRPPLWLEMWRDLGSEEERRQQRKAVWRLLSRLNERRFLLERDLACPLVLVLPLELRMDVPSMIPDLWSVRAFTADLPAPAAATIERGTEPLPEPPTPVNLEPAWVEREWQRLWEATADRRRLAPEAGFAAVEAALERMDIPAARTMAEQVWQAMDGREETSAVLRQRSTALDYMGDIGMLSGKPEDARAAYVESLELRRRLIQATGENPQALRDLSISLNKIGDADSALNRLEEARGAYAESLETCRRLIASTGETPQALRDLSISLNKIGDVDSELNRLEEARGAYAESLEICRRLIASTGETPQALRDLSISLNKIGDVDSELNRLEEARGAYAESLEICRRLIASTGETPQALRDLSISLIRVGVVDRALDRFGEARTAYDEAMAIHTRLATAFPDIPSYREERDGIAACLEALP
jgi:tetratricopeptide (TPR) repeat protein